MSSCATCGAEQSLDASPLLLCSKCKTIRYCSEACQRTDWKTHKKTCRRPTDSSSSTATQIGKVPCVFITEGIFDQPAIAGLAHTERTYPKNLLSGPNVVDSKISELLGTPLRIIAAPANVKSRIDVQARTSKFLQKHAHEHGTMLTMETDPTKPEFGRPTITIPYNVAFVRKDGKFLDWRIVEHMAMYVEIEIQKRLSGEMLPEPGMTRIQSAQAMMCPEAYQENFWEAREMFTLPELPKEHWMNPGWGEAIADDPF